MNTTTFIQLGRIGDILNILPAVRAQFIRTDSMPYLVVAEEFKELFDSITYAHCEAFPGHWMDIRGAIDWVLKRRALTDLRICTVCGNDYSIEKRAWNFQREAWRLSRVPEPWGECVPLCYETSESEVARDLLAGGTGPYILVALSGLSSPVPDPIKALVLSRLREAFENEKRVIDISEYRAPKITDLCAVIQACDALVCCDSAVMHLARSRPYVRTCALISDNPDPWYKSWWTPDQIFRCCYSELPDHIDEMIGAIAGTWSLPKIVHCWSRPEWVSDDTCRRQTIAQLSWQREAHAARDVWIEAPLHDMMLNRDARRIGDPVPMPFVRDIIDHGASRATSDTDILAVTNADVGWPQGITGAILDAVRMRGSAWTHRWDMEGSPLSEPPLNEWDVANLRWYCGSDLFAFTVGWWKTIGRDFPDMVLGREAWDYVMRVIIKRNGGAEIHRALFHERHTSFWEIAGNRETLRGNVHNMELARRFMEVGVPDTETFTPSDLVFTL